MLSIKGALSCFASIYISVFDDKFSTGCFVRQLQPCVLANVRGSCPADEGV